jgi:hypothetical protein
MQLIVQGLDRILRSTEWLPASNRSFARPVLEILPDLTKTDDEAIEALKTQHPGMIHGGACSAAQRYRPRSGWR